MAKIKKNTEEENSESKQESISTKDLASNFLKSKDVKDFHYNFEASVIFKVSSGSLILDKELGGGYGPGLQRLCGASGGGKTSHAVDVMGNFLSTVERSKGIYVKAEGRLSDNIQKRRGLKFVSNPEDWEIGTVLLFETNVYEIVFDFIRLLFKNNLLLPVEERERFCFIIDSMDGLIRKEDLEKSSSESNKVAGGALLQSDFFRKVSLGMGKFGHMCFMTSQVRSKVSIDPYAPKDPNNLVGSSGGNAAVHYPDYILDFKRQMKTNKIVPNAKAPIDNDNRPLGHYVELTVAKSDNENQMMTVRYPIKYGRVGRSSVWIEREIIEMLLMWGYIKKGGSWFSFEEEVISYVKDEHNIDLVVKMQGLNSLYDYLENDQSVQKALEIFVREKILPEL